MLDKLEQIVSRFEELTQELSSPELLSNPSAYAKAAKQHRSLAEVVQKYQAWKGLKAELSGARELYDTSDDDEMREMARLELDTLQARLEENERELKLLLVPSDPNDEKNVILEIRAGTGGDEATLFAAEMLREGVGYLVYTIVDANNAGWLSGQTLGLAAVELVGRQRGRCFVRDLQQSGFIDNLYK